MKRVYLRRLNLLPVTLLLWMAVSSLAQADDPLAPPPDLRLEWLIDGRRGRTADAVRGSAGEVVRLDYVLLNVGGSPAFAALLSATTTLGPLPASQRLQPGPAPGQSVHRTLPVPLAAGVRQVCVQVRLQTARAADPGDPNPDDNLLCRDVIVAHRHNAATPGNSPPLYSHGNGRLKHEFTQNWTTHTWALAEATLPARPRGRDDCRPWTDRRAPRRSARLGQPCLATGAGWFYVGL